MVNFSSDLPTWQAEGVRPPDNMLIAGWKASQKPPADYFNWFFNRTHNALKELQEKAATESNLDLHTARSDNPHKVTAMQVGLGNVLNQKQATKVEFDGHDIDQTRHITTAERTNWNSKASGAHSHTWGDIQNVPSATLVQQGVVKLIDSVASTDTTAAATANTVKRAFDRGSQGIADAAVVQKNLDTHSQNKNNPHSVNPNQIGLGNVSNFGIATAEEAIVGTSNIKYVTPFTVSEAIKALQSIKTVNGKTGAVVLGKSDVGLGNVDNVQQATKIDFNNHVTNNDKHITVEERTNWNSKSAGDHKHPISQIEGLTNELNNKVKIADVLIKPKQAAESPETYPSGISVMQSQTGFGYPDAYSTVITHSVKEFQSTRTAQILINKAGMMWIRSADSDLTNGWTAFGKYAKEDGNVTSATKLQTIRKIAGVAFDGTSDISIPAGNVGAYTKTEVDTAIKITNENIIFVGSDEEWDRLTIEQKNKYILRGIPK